MDLIEPEGTTAIALDNHLDIGKNMAFLKIIQFLSMEVHLFLSLFFFFI